MTMIIKLTQGYEAVVSSKDYPRLSQKKWHALVFPRGTYAGSMHNGSAIYMHRFITDCPKGMVVDHINGNTLDNRRENLRVCTNAQNLTNTRKKTSNTKYKGVHRQKGRTNYMAVIGHGGKCIYLGTFETEELAAQAYNDKAIELHGEYASLNEV